MLSGEALSAGIVPGGIKGKVREENRGSRHRSADKQAIDTQFLKVIQTNRRRRRLLSFSIYFHAIEIGLTNTWAIAL